MAISLLKGGRVSLSKESPDLQKIKIALGWDTKTQNDTQDFDLDVSVFLLTNGDKVISDEHFIFYNNLTSPCGAVVHQRDNRVGGDGEEVLIDLGKLSHKVEKIVFVVTIHDAEARNQNFGKVNNAFISIVDEGKNKEMARYELNKDASASSSVNFGELFKEKMSWNFKAVGQGIEGGLMDFCKQYGVNV